MQPYDLIIENGIVITMDPSGSVIQDGAVAVSKDTIACVTEAKSLRGAPAVRRIDAKGGIIMPGLVNAHTHAAMTCFRGLADDMDLMTWLNDHIFPAERRLTGDMVYTGTLLAVAEMILSGTTCFADMYLYTEAVAKAADLAGIRAVVGEVLYDFPSPCYGDIEKGFEYTCMLIERWADNPRIKIAVEPHSPYLCAPDLLLKAEEISSRYDTCLIIHLAETHKEVEIIRERYQKRPVEYLQSLGLLSPRLLACHCVYVEPDEIRMMADSGARVSHNPESNMKLASGVAPVPGMIARGVCVALGTDGPTSNNNLDLMAEMDTAAKLHKVFTNDPTVMDARQVVAMATINGARALGFEDITGSLVPGKKADIIVVDVNRPHLVPMYDPFSHLVYAARADDVVLSVIDGKLVMADRQLLTIDVDAVMKRMDSIAEQMIEFSYKETN